MNLKLLRSFVVLADSLHFGLAAQRLCMTQPALTKQIRLLESELGAPLLTRGRHGAVLTGFGQYFQQEARKLLAQADDLNQRAQRAAKGEVGCLAIGFGLSSIELAPRRVAVFRQRYPDIEIRLEDMSSAAQSAQLLSGELQLGFMRLPVAPPLSYVILQEDHLAVAAMEHDSGPITMVDLAALPLIGLLPQRGPGLAGQIEQLFAEQGLQPRYVQKTSDIQTVLALVAAGAGAAIVPQSAARIAPPGVRLQPLAQHQTRWQVGLVWNPVYSSLPRDRFIESVTAS